MSSSLSVVINDLDLMGAVLPDEANAPLIIDSNAVLSPPVPSEGFQAVPAQCLEVVQTGSSVEATQLLPGPVLDLGRKVGRLVPSEDAPRLPAPEAVDHTVILPLVNAVVKRQYCRDTLVSGAEAGFQWKREESEQERRRDESRSG
jgi:hypothetical protein